MAGTRIPLVGLSQNLDERPVGEVDAILSDFGVLLTVQFNLVFKMKANVTEGQARARFLGIGDDKDFRARLRLFGIPRADGRGEGGLAGFLDSRIQDGLKGQSSLFV